MEPHSPAFADPLLTIRPLQHRRPGRPKGAKGKVLHDLRALGVHHFSFVHASLLGQDLAEAFNRYLAWSESTADLRHVQHRRDALLKHIIAAGRHLDATLGAEAKITPLVDALDMQCREESHPPEAAGLPTLLEWMATKGVDPEAWSEADLLAEYKAAFPGHFKGFLTRVQALNQLETVLSVVPRVTDQLASWFAPTVVACLRKVGLMSLADLVNFINVYGYRWHGRIQGFGAQRAQMVVVWLIEQQAHLNLTVSPSAREPKSQQELRTSAWMPDVGQSAAALAPFGAGTWVAGALARMHGTADLNGERGDFRSHLDNSLGASNDLEAVNAWLARYNDNPSTQRSYRKEVERFLLWCTQELQKPLSSVNAPDCHRYREFLQAVPARWIQSLPLKRTDPAWRAFRSQPTPASQKQALVILLALFTGLTDAGYLVANPLRVPMQSFDLPASQLDIRRAFTEAEWAYVLSCLEALPFGPARLRLKCILELLVTSGIRLDELARARHSDVRLAALPGLAQTWVLTVTGKRNQTREIPLNPDVVKLLALHGAQFAQQDRHANSQADLPLIRTLAASVSQWRIGQGGALQRAPLSDTPGSALSAAGIYGVIKRFFHHVSQSARDAGLDAARFEKASTHWMRHTFVCQALVDGMPIEIAGELAGHATLDTTLIYSTQQPSHELARSIRAVLSMKRRVAR